MSSVLATPTYDLAGLILNTQDDNGVAWVVEDEDGWTGTPDPRLDFQERAEQDGAYDSPLFWQARTITLTGTTEAPTKTAKLLAKDQLSALMARRSLWSLQVAEDHLTRRVMVKSSGRPKMSDLGSCAFAWQLTLTAPDPLRYGALQTLQTFMADATSGHGFPHGFPLGFGSTGSSGGSVNCVHPGTEPTWPIITFQAGPSGLVSPRANNLNTGAILDVNTIMAPGDTLVFDTFNRTILLNGTGSKRGDLISGATWFSIAPGVGTAIQFGADVYDSTSTMSVAFAPAWT